MATRSAIPSSAEAQSGMPEVEALRLSVDALVAAAAACEAQRSDDIVAVDPCHRDDAANLAHYLALRHADVRQLQRRLAEHGLSSLGRCEPHVLATLLAVRAALGDAGPPPDHTGFEAGRRALDRNTDRLLGPRPAGRVPRIMVTLPTEAAADEGVVRRFVERGMDLARVNGAHDDAAAWEAMARNVADAGRAAGRHIPVCVDLPGPKLRTGPLAPGPSVVRFRPQRDQRGVPVAPARVLLTTAPAQGDAPTLPVDASWLAACRPGDTVRLSDTRGSARVLTVVECGPECVTAEAWDTTYVETGTVLHNRGAAAAVGWLPALEQHLELQVGDRLRVVPGGDPLPAWHRGDPGLPTIGCDLDAVFAAVRAGHRVFLDDGKFAGVLEDTGSTGFTARITAAPEGGGRLRAEKGINLPDTDLPVPVVADADLELLDLAAEHADMVGLSFLRHENDVDVVIEQLARRGADHLGLVCKIETMPGFQRLPEILLHGMRSQRLGVMIARGDLAVESSFERLAEVQEEILWLCEAAHVPVIWATQVLDQLARTGQPSRAEITDAAMAQRAECVMLNKGDHIDAAIGALDDILRRMAGHQRKKMSLLRPLHAWDSA